MHRRAAALLAVALIALSAAHVTDAAAAGYVALGDSYSSGTGTRDYDEAECQRSRFAYPRLLAGDWPAGPIEGFRDYACAGARAADLLDEQLPMVPAGTGYVTVSIGGNDAGFGSVLRRCALPWPFTCWAAIAEVSDFIRGVLPARLGQIYAAIRRRAPGAHVVVAGYPRLFGPGSCAAAAGFSLREQAELNRAADLLRDVELASVTAAGPGFGFADAVPSFAGHEVCSGDAWLNGLSIPIGESFHPNREGHELGYLPLLASALAPAG